MSSNSIDSSSSNDSLMLPDSQSQSKSHGWKGPVAAVVLVVSALFALAAIPGVMGVLGYTIGTPAFTVAIVNALTPAGVFTLVGVGGAGLLGTLGSLLAIVILCCKRGNKEYDLFSSLKESENLLPPGKAQPILESENLLPPGKAQLILRNIRENEVDGVISSSDLNTALEVDCFSMLCLPIGEFIIAKECPASSPPQYVVHANVGGVRFVQETFESAEDAKLYAQIVVGWIDKIEDEIPLIAYDISDYSHLGLGEDESKIFRWGNDSISFFIKITNENGKLNKVNLFMTEAITELAKNEFEKTKAAL